VSEQNQSLFGLSPPPRRTDVLFRPDDDFGTNACLAHWHDVERAYTDGYRTAARHLAKQVCDSQSEQDRLVYPIVYLYRHHAELVLKGIIDNASALLDRKLTDQDYKTLGRHDLVELWEMAWPSLNAICKLAGEDNLPIEDLEGVTSYIQQIHEHDPDGQRFRYATTKLKSSGSRKAPSARGPSLSPELNLINIRVFAIAMENLADYLEGIESWLGGLRQGRDEMHQDAYGY
jgi:hypothetical protein